MRNIGTEHERLLEALPVVERSARRVRRRYGARLSEDARGIGNLALWEALPRFVEGPGRSLDRFAKRRVFGAMMNEVRRATVRMHGERDGAAGRGAIGLSGATDLLADAEENVLAVEALRAVLQDLAEEDRLLLDLLFGDELDQHQVGEVLGIAHETVCRRLGRLRTKLRRGLRALGVGCAPPPMRLPDLQAVLRGRVSTAQAA
jgi:RNA polymerase sigma factor (sigma-70 family)